MPTLFELESLAIYDLKKIFAKIDNKVEICNGFARFRFPVIDDLLSIYSKKELVPVEVIEHRTHTWGPKFTIENVKEERLSATSTYASCIDAEIAYFEDEFYATLIVWDGDNMYGTRKEKRVSISFKLTEKQVLSKNIIESIYCEYESFLETVHEAFLKKQKRDWMLGLHSEIMEGKV